LDQFSIFANKKSKNGGKKHFLAKLIAPHFSGGVCSLPFAISAQSASPFSSTLFSPIAIVKCSKRARFGDGRPILSLCSYLGPFLWFEI
jgi:hypothetical protein